MFMRNVCTVAGYNVFHGYTKVGNDIFRKVTEGKKQILPRLALGRSSFDMSAVDWELNSYK